jgi:hypothetical protein
MYSIYSIGYNIGKEGTENTLINATLFCFQASWLHHDLHESQLLEYLMSAPAFCSFERQYRRQQLQLTSRVSNPWTRRRRQHDRTQLKRRGGWRVHGLGRLCRPPPRGRGSQQRRPQNGRGRARREWRRSQARRSKWHKHSKVIFSLTQYSYSTIGRGCQVFLGITNQNEKTYAKMAIKYQMAIKYTYMAME